MVPNITCKRLDLSEWKLAVTNKYPQLIKGHYYAVCDNVYYWHNIKGKNRWHRLTSKEVIDLYLLATMLGSSSETFMTLFDKGYMHEESKGKCVDE